MKELEIEKTNYGPSKMSVYDKNGNLLVAINEHDVDTFGEDLRILVGIRQKITIEKLYGPAAMPDLEIWYEDGKWRIKVLKDDMEVDLEDEDNICSIEKTVD